MPEPFKAEPRRLEHFPSRMFGKSSLLVQKIHRADSALPYVAG